MESDFGTDLSPFKISCTLGAVADLLTELRADLKNKGLGLVQLFNVLFCMRIWTSFGGIFPLNFA